MANTDSAPLGEYRPDMDGPAHEAMYRNFIHFATVAATFVACCVTGLAVGGVRAAWVSAIVMIVAAHIATAIGLFTPLSWRAPAIVLVLLLLMLLLY